MTQAAVSPYFKPSIKLSPISKAIQISLLSLGLVHGSSHAATIEVDSNSDDPNSGCTLREAIDSINAGSELGCTNSGASFGTNDLVSFSTLGDTNIGLTLGQINITQDVLINTNNPDKKISVDGGNLGRIFYADSVHLTIDNLSISNGSISSGNGAGIKINLSDVELNNCTISGNSASSFGAGVAISGSEVFFNSCTISNNSTSSDGGGVSGTNSSVINLINSTVSSNTANGNGGGIALDASTLDLSNSTMSDNTSANNGGGFYAYYYSTVNITNSIIANSDGYGCSESSSTINLDAASIVENSFDCVGIEYFPNPQLKPLSNNGGFTLTHALSRTSPARNRSAINCQTYDQRGNLRFDGDAVCDIGSIEFNSNDDVGFIVIPLTNSRAVIVPN